MHGLASSLIINKKVVTTLARAKELKRYFDSLMPKALRAKDPRSARQAIAKYLDNKKAISICVKSLRTKFKDRKGGYTRTVRTKKRSGDSAEMVRVELVD